MQPSCCRASKQNKLIRSRNGYKKETETQVQINRPTSSSVSNTAWRRHAISDGLSALAYTRHGPGVPQHWLRAQAVIPMIIETTVIPRQSSSGPGGPHQQLQKHAKEIRCLPRHMCKDSPQAFTWSAHAPPHPWVARTSHGIVRFLLANY